MKLRLLLLTTSLLICGARFGAAAGGAARNSRMHSEGPPRKEIREDSRSRARGAHQYYHRRAEEEGEKENDEKEDEEDEEDERENDEEEDEQEKENDEEADEGEEEADEEAEEEAEEEEQYEEYDEAQDDGEYNNQDDDIDDGTSDSDDGYYDQEYMSSLISTLLGSGASISDYHLQFAACTGVEGSANKNYRSTAYGYRHARHTYLHYHSCKNNDEDGNSYFSHFWGSFMCRRVSHVVRLDDYFRSVSDCVEEYCEGCEADCANDDNGGSSGSDCGDGCLDRCEGYYQLANEGSSSNGDYRGCAGPYNATDGNEYYLGPACSQSGGVTRSYFLDENCEIGAASSVDSIDFDDGADPRPSSLDAFKFVDGICTSCAERNVCERLYDSSFHCSDRTMKAVAVSEGTSWRPTTEEEEEEEGLEEGDGNEMDNNSGDDRGDYDERREFEFADEACYKTSTFNQQKQYQADSKDGTLMNQKVVNFLMAIGILVMIVGMLGFLALSYRYHVRHPSGMGSENLCSVSVDTDSFASDSYQMASEG